MRAVRPAPDSLLVIACGALAREIAELRRTRGWQHLDVSCIDARLHNRPARIPAALRERIRRHRDRYSRIFVAYADCGTGGAIDAVIREEGVERLPGVHCYQFFAGDQLFRELSEEEPGTFYLTDFLARNFTRLVVRELRLDTHPELIGAFFGNYRRLVYLAQTNDPALQDLAVAAADFLGLEYHYHQVGYGQLETAIDAAVIRHRHGNEENRRLLA